MMMITMIIIMIIIMIMITNDEAPMRSEPPTPTRAPDDQFRQMER